MHKLYPNRKVFEVCFRRAVAQLTAQPGRDDLYRFYSDYCRALEERGRFAEAIEMGQKSVALFDGHAKAHRCLARAYLGLGDERRAAPHLDFVDRASPNEKRLIEQWGEK